MLERSQARSVVVKEFQDSGRGLCSVGQNGLPGVRELLERKPYFGSEGPQEFGGDQEWASQEFGNSKHQK